MIQQWNSRGALPMRNSCEKVSHHVIILLIYKYIYWEVYGINLYWVISKINRLEKNNFNLT